MDSQIYLILGIGIGFILLTWWAILDVAYKDFSSFEKKIIWAFVVLIPFIGCILYLLFGRKAGKKRNAND